MLPALVVSAVWFSIVDHYYVANPVITDEMVEESRRVPQDEVLAELSTLYLMDAVARLSDARTLEVAEGILQGEFALPGPERLRFRLPFDARDLDQGSETWRLHQASLLVPRVLLKAYRASGRESFLVAARDIILAWGAHERGARLPRGRLWNDHAIAERVLALADFWEVYRNHPLYESRVAADVLLFAARSGSFLDDPSHFTVSTNHGVMQNLALWHLALAFPALPESGHHRQAALERLGDQMEFYVDEEGVVLEHSAEYQRVGLQFLSMAFRYLSLQGVPIPAEWREKYARAKDFYSHLRRPDGSLPMFGDTDGRLDPRGPPVTSIDSAGRSGAPDHRFDWSPTRARSWYPSAGYSVWWGGLRGWPDSREISQTVVAWSYFPGHAHKHADEGSVLLWAKGQTWWTNVGYWPYGTPGRAEAGSWIASNAPHLKGESVFSTRSTRMLGSGETEGLEFIDLERRGPQGYTVRRQVIAIGNDLWLVIDHTSSDPESTSRTVWTTAHDVRMSEGKIRGSYELVSESTGVVLTKFIIGSAGIRTRRYQGSELPLIGWQVVGEVPRPAPAVVVEQPGGDSWAVAVWSLSDGGEGAARLEAQPSMVSWEGPDEWSLALPFAAGTARVSRQADGVFVAGTGERDLEQGVFARPAPIEGRNRTIRSAHERALARYPKFSDHLDYRRKATLVCVSALFFQETFFALYRRFRGGHYSLLRGLSIPAWVAMGVWLVVIRTPLIAFGTS